MLSVENVAFAHTATSPRFHFHMCAKAGEVISIMGASGSGKSTLLDLIAGFTQPQSGTLLWNDVSLNNLPPENRPCTILFQKDNLFPHLTAETNVALGLGKTSRLSVSQKELIATALREVGLEDQQKQKAQTLSGGQQQRVALARSLVRDRPLLLLDEPFTGLDDTTRHAMLPLVQSMAKQHKRCVLMVTHDAEDAERIADRKFIMRNHRLEEQV